MSAWHAVAAVTCTCLTSSSAWSRRRRRPAQQLQLPLLRITSVNFTVLCYEQNTIRHNRQLTTQRGLSSVFSLCLTTVSSLCDQSAQPRTALSNCFAMRPHSQSHHSTTAAMLAHHSVYCHIAATDLSLTVLYVSTLVPLSNHSHTLHRVHLHRFHFSSLPLPSSTHPFPPFISIKISLPTSAAAIVT